MPYSTTQWAAGDPITQDRLNKMEQGIADAYNKSETATNTVQNLNGTVTSHTNSIRSLTTTLDTTTSIANTAYGMGEQGATAYSQIQGAIAESTDLHSAFPNLVSLINNIYSTIKTNKSAIEQTVSQQAVNITTISNEVTAARGQTKYTSVGNAPNLKAKIDDMEHQIDSNITAIGVINGALEDARGDYNSVQLRFEQDESDIDALQAEVNGAHTGSATTLNERFTANETAIGERILISSIRDSLTSNDDKAVLSAAQGKVLKDMIGSGFDSLNTVAASITKVANDAQSYVDNNKVDKTDIVKNLTHADNDDTVLQARQGKLLQDAIDTINNTLGGSYNESNTVNNAIATAKAEAISAAAGDATTKANAAEANAKGYASNLIYNGLDKTTEGMALDATQGKALNDIITDKTNGLAATKAIADSASTAATAANDKIGSGFSSTNTIAAAISGINSSLDNKASTTTVNAISTTIIKAKTEVVYVTVENEKVPSTTQEWTINSKDDYLLQNPDNDKYYYWKYINETWHLMGGAGSTEVNGGGTSSGEFVATLNSIQTPNENTDYFVGNNANGYLHYRYVVSNNTGEFKLVGTNPEKIKRYNIEKYVNNETSKSYLRFYEYNYGEDNEISDDLVELADWVPSTSYEVNDQVLYNDYGYTCITANSDAEWTPANWSRINEIRTVTTIELPEGGGGGASASGYRIYAKVRGDANRRLSYNEAQQGITVNCAYTCYSYDEIDGYDYRSVSYTLTRNDGKVISTSGNDVVNYLDFEDYQDPTKFNLTFNHLERECEINKTTTFTLTLHYTPGPNETDMVVRDKTVNISITMVNLELTSTYAVTGTHLISNSIQIPYTFVGMADQDVTFSVLLDNAPIIFTNQNNRIVIRPAQLEGKTGVHNLVITASQIIGGSTISSNSLGYQLGLVDNSTDSIMLFSDAAINTQKIEQYQILKLPYYLYIPNNGSELVTFNVEELTYSGDTITSRTSVPALIKPAEIQSSATHEYTLRIQDMDIDKQYYDVTISCGTESLVFHIEATRSEEQINIRTNDLLFDFKPERYSNNVVNEEDRLWSYTNGTTTYKMRIPKGAHFDWRTGGWITVNDVPCFCVKAGSRVEFVQEENNTTSPLTLFWHEMEELGGSNFKCTFKIDNVKTPNAPFLTSLDTNTNTIINYGKLILASKQDLEDDDTLLHSYLNTRYIYTETYNGSKQIKEAIGTTVLDNAPFSELLTNDMRDAATTNASKKNDKKIKQYISNIYDIANQASVQAHREYLLKVLGGLSDSATIDYSTIKDTITDYLFDRTDIVDGKMRAERVYDRLVAESNDSSSVTYAYRQVEPVNFDAMLNGFVVEGKAGKDGIIAMLVFTFTSTIKNAGSYSQTVSSTPISTNTFAKTGTFRVTVTDTAKNITKAYEVEMLDENQNGTYTEIVSIRDASNTETRAYGLELNALGSNIFLPSGVVSYAHSEGDIIEFEYNINPEITGRVNSSIIIYEDGVPSAAKLYTTGNHTFEQQNPGCLTIGSDDCDVYIYKMRLYGQAINNADILSNFYADGLTPEEMMNRYNRNKNLVNASTITPQLLATECPDIRVIMIEAPNLTGGKTSFIKNTKVRCIYKNGRPEDNWVALNAYHAGQGTSSDNYGASGRNLDIMFGFDGEDTVIVPKPQKNNYTFDPTYKSKLIKGLNDDLTNDILTAEEYTDAGYTVEENGVGKVSLTADSVPNNWFNIKVNIASSENTNNAFLQKRFDRYLPYRNKVPAMKRNENIKNDMEFLNCAIFIKEVGTPTEFLEDKDIPAAERPWHFYGIGNIGDSKKTDATRVNVEKDPYEFCIEITDNGLKNSGFYSGVFYISEQSKEKALTPRTTTNGNMDLPQALLATTFHICETNEYTVNGSTYTFSVGTPNTNTMYAVPVSGSMFTYYRRFMYINNAWQEVGEPITFERTSYGVKYPISQAEWECSLNDYHKSLYDLTSGKGWDKSFEFRYDITTKDGETVARNDLEAAMNSYHQLANKKAFADMYSWIVTSSNQDFHDHLNNWFIEESPLYWYLFTERYTMIDSRAKNTFYHYGKVYISQYEYDGHVLEDLNSTTAEAYATAHNIQSDGNVTALEIAAAEIDFKKTAAQFIYTNRDTFIKDDTLAAINDGYRFELWDYDNDTALGINNNGQMVFSAGLEDIDKDISGWIYNEAESVIWRRIRENMYDKLGALYIQLKGQCFNAENLIQEFDNMQSQFPEELWRLDFERKYYRPFISGGETTYLNDMANGRKKYQRRQFERNMAIYINSKYQRNGSYDENDIISFRPQFTWTAGRNTTIIIKPYSTMYINFALGNYDNTGDVTLDKTLSTRVNRGEALTINAGDYIDDFNNIQCIIYNASRIMELDGLGNFECKQFILGSAKKLSVLKLGSAEYPNRSMADVNNMGLSDGLPLLEELDLTNIQFGTAPDTFALDNFPLLKKLNATGCNIHSFTFKDGGMLEQIIFPSVLTRINFSNLYNLVDTYDDQNNLVLAVQLTGASNLTSYNSVNSYSNSYQIVQNMLNNAGINNITSLKLNDINWTVNTIDDLIPLEQCQNALGSNMELAGTITILGAWSTVEKNKYIRLWNNKVNIITNDTYKVEKHEVLYKDDLTDEVLYTLYANHEASIVDIYNEGLYPLPTREPTVSTYYQFGKDYYETYIPFSGWRIAGDSQILSDYSNSDRPKITRDTTIYTYFQAKKKEFTVRWVLEDEQGISHIISRNDNPVYYGGGYNLSAPTVSEIRDNGISTSTVTVDTNANPMTVHYRIFKGWEKLPTNIAPGINDETYDINGIWEEDTKTLPEMFADTSNLDYKQLLTLSAIPNKSTNSIVTGKISAGMTTTQTMGYSGLKAGSVLVSETSIRKYPLPSSPTSTVITPFDTNRGFTLAIDYWFDPDVTYGNKSAAFLLGCYESNINTNTASGFGLFQGLTGNLTGIRVGYGDMLNNINQSIKIGIAGSRNIVVLRKPDPIAYEPEIANRLYIYSATDSEGLITSTPVIYSIPWNQATMNAVINLGRLAENLDNNASGAVAEGQGIIYWAKYWDEDLGVGECQQIASWPHEKITFALSHYLNTVSSRGNSNNDSYSVELVTVSGTQHGQFTQSRLTPNPSMSNHAGWSQESAMEVTKVPRTYGMRTLYNTIVFNGLPLELQSIICKKLVSTMPVSKKTDDFNSSYYVIDAYQTESTRDYIYGLSLTDIRTVTNDPYLQELRSGGSTLPWLLPSNVIFYRYNSGSNNWSADQTASNRQSYLNIRFPGISTPLTQVRIFEGSSQITGAYYNAVNTAQNGITRGDIYVTSDAAYMYVTNADVNSGIQVQPNSGIFACPQGGWVKSHNFYLLRSASAGENSYDQSVASNTNYAYVSATGSFNSKNTNAITAYVNYAFSI